MTRRASPRRALSVLLAALTLATAAPVAVFAVDDTTPPSGTITINDGAAFIRSAAATLTLTATDDASEVTTVILSNGDGNWESRPFAATMDWSLDAGGWITETTHAVYARFQDSAGNTSEIVSDTIEGDHTDPVGTIEYLWTGDGKASFGFDATDALSGIAGVRFTCESGAPIMRAYATKITVVKASLGCGGYGLKDLTIDVLDGAGNALSKTFAIGIDPTVTVHVSASPTTGHAITLSPVFPPDMTVPSDTRCLWEFRWGTSAALDEISNHDETFGSLLTEGAKSSGACAPWTLTLPWVPYPLFEYRFSVSDPDTGDLAPTVKARFTAAIDSTDRRITSSTLPIAYILPSTYTPIVGQPITYTIHPVGTTIMAHDSWNAQIVDDQAWVKEGGSTFTITPDRTGHVLVCWNGGPPRTRLIGACYDPPVRYPDRSAPTTTAPKVSIGGVNVATGAVPTTIAWTGRDVGWGIKTYQLQRSIDGGAWRTVVLPKPTSTSIALSLSAGHGFRFRVRAIDKAGHYGAWDTGPTFKPWALQESNAKVTFHSAWKRRADATALGGQLAGSTTAGSSARATVTARAVAWVAAKGPTEGKATVYVDGKAVATVDLRYASTMPHRVVWSRAWSSVGTHTVKIVVAGTAGRPDVTLDAILVLA